MEYRKLGDGGLTVSAITYGNWLTHSRESAEAAHACVAAALDEGVTTFDTADVYGNPDFGAAERVLGDALAGVRRSSVEICTKVCMPSGPGANDRGLSRKHVMESCHASLRRLRTDHIDLYQAHRYDEETPLEETMTAFADLVRQGKILYLGVSEWRPDQIEAAAALAAELGVRLISNQPQYSILWRVIEEEVLPACERLGLGQIVFSPVAQGTLTGKYLPQGRAPESSRAADDRGARFVGRYLGDPVLAAVQRLRPVADGLGLTLAQLAVAWVLQNPGVSSAIIGASRPEQLRENTAAAGVGLDEETMAAIDAAFVDETHGDLVERDPAKIASPFDVMAAWRA
ncbi:aldo/keto reductase family protein [Actinomadura sp. DC4]|uniref:aldo/keto reductase family protein n=1 Tax=Actinomadura sp. DC4 TaxID=3055069 RepID=UPI0025B196A7|nr:aldo/keto reductase family protein [Actinomadura sp. DC4]MDN3351119.1 aldo/keto reductase family protein [Actinomadura sp. DC4]